MVQRRAVFVGLIGAVTVLAACASDPAGQGPSPDLLIQGALTYRERMALPDNAVAVVRVQDAYGAQLAGLRFETDGRQVPIPFAFTVDRAMFAPNTRYFVSAAIELDGAPRWTASPVLLDTRAETADLGSILLTGAR
jgi:uncharacterized lipoprotein YbaY